MSVILTPTQQQYCRRSESGSEQTAPRTPRARSLHRVPSSRLIFTPLHPKQQYTPWQYAAVQMPHSLHRVPSSRLIFTPPHPKQQYTPWQYAAVQMPHSLHRVPNSRFILTAAT